MDLKFYLNKFLKADNIEHYTLGTLQSLKKSYDNFLETTEGVDPDFPEMTLGNFSKGVKIKGTNYFSLFDEEEIRENDQGLKENLLEL